MSPAARERRDVVIIGAGAAGLFCAAVCGRRGRSVVVLDHNDRAGAKIRISGGGRCNFTNLAAGPAHYRSGNPGFAASALARLPPPAVVALLDRHGIPWEERGDGQLFCLRSAGEVVAALERECRSARAEIRLGCRVGDVTREAGFRVGTSRGVIRASSLVVATGGLSYPSLGASDFGLDLARRFGLAVVEPRPALVPFVFPRAGRAFFAGLAGVSLEAAIACSGRSWRGRLLFTHRGISGPAALQASLFWSPGTPLVLDLAPGTDVLALLQARRRGGAQLHTVLSGLLPRRFAAAWCEREGFDGTIARLPERTLQEVATRLHAWELSPAGTEGYATAEATSGGVDTAGLSSKTLEAREVPGLHFVGEVVDVTGEVGGYNLHWAWASGNAAGEHA